MAESFFKSVTTPPLWLWLCLTSLSSSCGSPVKFASSADLRAANMVLDQSFPVAAIAAAGVTFKPQFGIAEDHLTLRQLPPKKISLRQLERGTGTDSFRQGNDGKTTVDGPFDISSAGKIDIAIVIDNSSSMTSYQDRLKSHLQDLLSRIKDTDWQIAISTSDRADTCIRDIKAGGPGHILSKAEFDNDPVGTQAMFESLIAAGAGGSGDEESLWGAERALQPALQGCKANHWLRPDAAIAVLVVTDEDNCHASTDGNFHHSAVPTKNNVVVKPLDRIDGCSAAEYNGDELLSLLSDPAPAGLGRTLGVNARIYGIFFPTGAPQNPSSVNPSNACQRNAGSNEGWVYNNLISKTGGTFGDICDEFGPILSKISQDLPQLITTQFNLTYTPIAGTVQVVVDGAVIPGGYTLEGKKLVFPAGALHGKKITISYQHLDVPLFDRVKLSRKAVRNSVKVAVDGSILPESKFSLAATADEIDFSELPPDNAQITIEYRLEGRLPTSFALSSYAMAGAPLQVEVDGLAATNVHFDPAAQSISFDTPPADDARIDVTYRDVADKVSRYAAPVLAAPGSVKSISAKDSSTGAPLTMTIDADNYVFLDDDIADGRSVTIDYNYGDRTTVLTHPLANLPLAGTLQVHSGGTTAAADCITNVKLEGTNLNFMCDGDQLGEVHVSYRYVAEQYTSFTLAKDVPPGGSVRVFVDGQSTGFKRTGRTITLSAQAPEINSTVRVIVSAPN